MKLHQAVPLLLAASLLGGCATYQQSVQRQQARLAAIHAAAGKPVNSFRYDALTMYSWEPLGEHEVLVYTRPDKAWLLNVGLCPRLPYTPSIGITSHTGQVSTLLDSVLTQGGQYPCRIQKIQPVDVAMLRRHMQQHEGAKVVPESSPAGKSQ